MVTAPQCIPHPKKPLFSVRGIEHADFVGHEHTERWPLVADVEAQVAGRVDVGSHGDFEVAARAAFVYTMTALVPSLRVSRWHRPV